MLIYFIIKLEIIIDDLWWNALYRQLIIYAI